MLMLLKKWLLSALSLFIVVGLRAQEVKTSVLIRTQEKEVVQEMNLSGLEAEQFLWQDYADQPVELIVRSEKHTNPNDPKHGVDFFIQNTHKVLTVDNMGRKKEYLWRGTFGLEDGGAFKSRYFELLDHEDYEKFPFITIDNARKNGGGASDELNVYWSERGECPLEIDEGNLPAGEMLVFFEDNQSQTLMKLMIKTRLIPIESEDMFRLVEIEVIKN